MATITLDIEQNVAERMKTYALRHHTSVSRIAENYFMIITGRMKTEDVEISPLVKSLSIDGVEVPPDFDYRQALAEARNEKYL